MANVKTYVIGDKTYEQRPLVLGQLRQLQDALQGVEIDPKAGTRGMIQALGDKMPQLLAIVLVEQGQTPADKDLAELARELEFGISLDQTIQAVDDFFDCNPLLSLLEKATGTLTAAMSRLTGSKNLSASSPAATSPGETPCCGDALRPDADPTLSTASEN